MYKHSPSVISVALVLGFGVTGVQAGTCFTSDVGITKISTQGDSPTVIFQAPTNGPAITASDCIAAGDRNPSPSQNGFNGDNRGFRGEGDLNTWADDGGLYGEYGAFVTEDDLQALKDPNVAEDPGWIFVGKQDIGGGTEWGTITNGGDEFSFESFFDDDFSKLLSVNVGEGCDDGEFCGTWSYTPPENYPEDLKNVLGQDKIFDQIAIVLKSGPESTIYNFKISDLFSEIPENNYAYEGFWDTSASMFNDKGNQSPYGLSNFQFYLRDPTVESAETPVPTPASLILMATGLIGLGVFQKRRA